MLKLFVEIKDSPISAPNKFESDLSISRTVAFKKTVRKYVAHLEQMNDVTLDL